MDNRHVGVLVLAILAVMVTAGAVAAGAAAGAATAAGSQPEASLPTAFGEEDIAVFERLVELAVGRAPAVLDARVAVEQAKLNESLAGTLTRAITVTVGADVATPSFEQVQPVYKAGLTVDLARLVTPTTSVVQAKQAALDAQIRTVRVDVMKAYTGYRVALSRAQGASLALENRLRQLEVVRAQVRAGTAAPADVIGTQDAVNEAQVSLYSANADLLVAKLELARVVGVSLDELNGLLAGGPQPDARNAPATSPATGTKGAARDSARPSG